MNITLTELLKEETVEKAIIDCICTEVAKSMRQTVIEVDETLWELLRGKCQTEHGICVIETVIRTKATRAYSRWQKSKRQQRFKDGQMLVITLKANESTVHVRCMTLQEYASTYLNLSQSDSQKDEFEKYLSALDAEIDDGIKS